MAESFQGYLAMVKRRIYDLEKQTHFVTFLCYNRRMLLHPVRAGLSARAADWKWSSARWHEQGQSVGTKITWPPRMELGDEFTLS
jgi:hypothetical protein